MCAHTETYMLTALKAAKKKMYMLFELEPDSSLTGGKWYTEDHLFEAEYIERLTQLCMC